MKKTLSRVALAVMMAAGLSARASTRDVAYGYRMPGGFAGDVNRNHPASILPCLVNTSVQTPRLYGDPVLVNAADSTVRGFVVGDTTTPATIYGVTVRSFPTQQSSGGMSAALQTTGAGVAINTTQPLDVLRQGYIMVKVPPGAAATKGSAVYVWFAATAGNNIQGGFVASASAGNAALITNARFNGVPDANGIVELEVWPA